MLLPKIIIINIKIIASNLLESTKSIDKEGLATSRYIDYRKKKSLQL